MQQQLALGQGIKHLMALETSGFGIDDMEMKRRSKIDLDWMSAMPFRVHQLNGGLGAPKHRRLNTKFCRR